MGRRMRLAGLAVAGLMLAATPVAAQKRIPEPLDAAEAAVLPDLAVALAAERPQVAPLDALLARLPRPTPLRGVVQSIRATALLGEDRNAEAKAAAEEAVRLTPEMAMTRIIASYVLTFVGTPAAAAGYWLEASTLDPEMARQTEEYQLTALVGRLRDAGQAALADKVAARMAELGVVEALAPARSVAAAARLRTLGPKAGEAAIGDVLAPDDMQTFYTDREWAPLWPAIARWSGEDLGQLDARYMEELRREWWARRSIDSAVAYGRALNARGAYGAVATLFAPLLTPERTGTYNPGMEFLTPVVARALYRTGRGAEAARLIDRIAAAMPEGAEGLRLNLSAARITRAYESDDWSELERRSAAWLAEASRMEAQLNTSAVLMVQAYRVCALEKLGRGSETPLIAAPIDAAARSITAPAVTMRKCRGDLAGLRKLTLAGLANTDQAAYFIALLQPRLPDPTAGVQEHADEALLARLAADPAVLAALGRVGRRLPTPVAERLPDGFDPLLDGPAPRPSRDSI